MSPSRSKGMNLERAHILNHDYENIEKNIGENIKTQDEISELAKSFVTDKTALEDCIDRVNRSIISDADKADMIAELNKAIERKQEQYEKDVVVLEEKIKSDMDLQNELINEAVDELKREEDELRGLDMEVNGIDASAAADEADKKKQEFIRMQNETTEKYRLQQEQAADMLMRIRTRRFSKK